MSNQNTPCGLPCNGESGVCEFNHNPTPRYPMTALERAAFDHLIAYAHGETDVLPPGMESAEALAARVRREAATW